MDSWIFGIDGGGTSSRLRIETIGGDLLFRAEGGGTNLNSNPRAVVAATLSSLFSAAYSSGIGLEPKDCAAGFASSAGVDKEADRDAFALLLREATGIACPIAAGNDAEASLVGALGDTEGLLLIAGTGSIAYGRSRDGAQVRAGGWGHVLGDEGSAFSISLQAVSRSFRSMEGRDIPTSLMGDALEFFGGAEPEDLLRAFYGEFDKAAIARFARAVGAARDRGDLLALDIFARAARDLAGLVASVHARIGSRLERRRLALRGGLIEGDVRLRSETERAIAAQAPGVEIVPAAADAAAGACALARALVS
jgi:N-acetylglucosamine kinase-like BadF-type ATPase